MAHPPSSTGDGAPTPGGSTSRNTLLALRLGITLLASLGGVVVYVVLDGFGIPSLLAVLLGLGFALLSRQAASSLLLDALVRRARQSRAETQADGRASGPRSEQSTPRE